ncbi:phosphotransferase [Pseudonocardia sp. RS010]|uniref:phosphotransferase n=1 Tax=Pseudonocardia sp. RS010 TaxID=3385979 RepID=UPI0039A24CED
MRDSHRPAAGSPPGAHDVLREARLLAGLAPTGVPVPAVLATAEAGEVIDSPLSVMSLVAGPVITTSTPPELTGRGREIGESMVDTLHPGRPPVRRRLLPRELAGARGAAHPHRSDGCRRAGAGLPDPGRAGDALCRAHRSGPVGSALVHRDGAVEAGGALRVRPSSHRRRVRRPVLRRPRPGRLLPRCSGPRGGPRRAVAASEMIES